MPATTRTVGRAADSTLVLKDDYSSSRHARFFPSDGQWIVEQLVPANSRNVKVSADGRIGEHRGSVFGIEIAVECAFLDFRRCLEVQMPYLGPVIGTYTDWTPVAGRGVLFPEDIDEKDAWQFKNILVR